MNKIIAVFGALSAIALFSFTIIFFLQRADLESKTLIQFTSIIALSNLIVAITSTLPFLIKLYSNRPLIEIDYKNKLYLIENEIWMSIKVINYGTAEAKNPSLKLYKLEKDGSPTKLVDYYFRYTMLKRQEFEFYLNGEVNQKAPESGTILIAEIGYTFFRRRHTVQIPFIATLSTDKQINLTTKEITGSISYLSPSCLNFEKSQQIIESFKRQKK